jgi:hypothetical protein
LKAISWADIVYLPVCLRGVSGPEVDKKIVPGTAMAPPPARQFPSSWAIGEKPDISAAGYGAGALQVAGNFPYSGKAMGRPALMATAHWVDWI